MTVAADRHMARKSLLGYEGLYECDENGNVWSVDRVVAIRSGGKRRVRERMLHVARTYNGYMSVQLCKDGIASTHSVHRLVCAAFHGKPEKEELHCNHVNGIRGDNRPANLEWVTPSENELHAYRKLGKKATRSMLGKFGADHNKSVAVIASNIDGRVIFRFGGLQEAGRNGFCATRISACLNGRAATHRGLTWSRENG